MVDLVLEKKKNYAKRRNQQHKQPNRNSSLNFRKITKNKLVQDSRQRLRNWPSVARMAKTSKKKRNIFEIRAVKDNVSALKIYGG